MVIGEEVYGWKAVGSASGLFEGHCQSASACHLAEDMDPNLERVRTSQIQ